MQALTKVDELRLKSPEKSGAGNTIGLPKEKPYIKMCVYFESLDCVVPHGHLNICKNCPIGYLYCVGFAIKNIYYRIIGLAVNILKMEDQTGRNAFNLNKDNDENTPQ